MQENKSYLVPYDFVSYSFLLSFSFPFCVDMRLFGKICFDLGSFLHHLFVESFYKKKIQYLSTESLAFHHSNTPKRLR